MHRALLVAGMHRSGTSALTRTLSLVGGALASKLAGGVAGDNDLGFWEPVEVVALHDRALASAGSAWDDVSRFPEDWFASDVGRAFGDELLALLRREFAEVPLFAIKDPRLCRLVPLWLAVLPRLGVRAQFVLPLRSPAEVAASLKARNDFPLAKGYLVWLRNVLDAEWATRGQERVFVTYEGLLAGLARGGAAHRRGPGDPLAAAVTDRGGGDRGLSVPGAAPPARRLGRGPAARRGARLGGAGPRRLAAIWPRGDRAAEAELDAVREELDRADDTYGRALAGMGFRVDEAVARLQGRRAVAGRGLGGAGRLQPGGGAAAGRRSPRRQSGSRDMIARQQEAMRSSRRPLSQLREQMQGLYGTIDRLNGEIVRLNQVRAEEQRAYEERIAEILASTSWRLTAPVRVRAAAAQAAWRRPIGAGLARLGEPGLTAEPEPGARSRRHGRHWA